MRIAGTATTSRLAPALRVTPTAQLRPSFALPPLVSARETSASARYHPRAVGLRVSVSLRVPATRCWATQSGDQSGWVAERELWVRREQALMAELAATRAQMGQVLEMQHSLIQLVTCLTQGGTSSTLAGRLTIPDALSAASVSANSPPAPSAPSRPASSAVPGPSTPSSASNTVLSAMALVSNASSSYAGQGYDSSADSSSASGSNSTGGMDSSNSTASSLGAGEGVEEHVTYDGPVEIQKSAVQGQPPDMMYGDDDIYWMTHVHSSLGSLGFHVDEDEVDNWLFGEGTNEAVMTFQATAGLPETGIVDNTTWDLLLKELPDTKKQIEDDIASGAVPNSSVDVPGAKPQVDRIAMPWEFVSAPESTKASPPASSHTKALSERWPVLREGDGGKAVHLMQLKVSALGYNCGEDEMRWWMFESCTNDALRTFQACSNMAETGICDERTWKALLGEDVSHADLEDLVVKAREAFGGDDDFSQDISWEERLGEEKDSRVWLIGEQRWATE